MDIDTHLQVWKALRPHLIGGDIDEAAEDFLRVLVEHGADAEEIAEFALDSSLKAALSEYLDEVDEDDYEDDDYEELEFQ